ncbi:ionotropic receptor 21a-like isoform X2 [Daktulosphaira vitifoliae]|uniref:ionotropic receptor 21a-like isoform X2 n=1 Tax=Daktulosphaira vitifoliae TaxID=58002 RepID=UPI0021A9C999|nr:ionotropic receptor 21a-like isoform X2 [Daktulosphaira vitifoliae]
MTCSDNIENVICNNSCIRCLFWSIGQPAALYSLRRIFKVNMTISYSVKIATVVFLFPFNMNVVFALLSLKSTDDRHTIPYDQDVFTLCKLVISESYALSLTIFSDFETIQNDFIIQASFALNTSWVFFNKWYNNMSIDHAGLIATNGSQRMSWLLTNVNGLWDSAVYYVWLIPTANDSVATELFQLAWTRHSMINVVLLTFSAVYTYNPFSQTLTQYCSVDKHALKKDFKTKIKNLHRYPVRISMFPTKLKAIAQSDGTYRGYDGFSLSILSKRMNFTPVISKPRDGKFYGWMEPNGTYTGALADIVNGVADIAFNGVLLMDYSTNANVQFTTVVQYEELCFVVPKAGKMSQWRAIFTAFQAQLWCLLAVSYFMSIVAWSLIKRTTDMPYTTMGLAINLFQVFLMVPLHRMPNNVPERLIVISAVVFGFITSTSLQAVMVKYISIPKYEKNINTVQEVYDTGLPILSSSKSLANMFKNTTNEYIYDEMYDRFILKQKSINVDILGEVSNKKNYIAIGRKRDLLEKMTEYKENNEVILHIVEECPWSLYISYLISRQAVYRKTVDELIAKLFEGGIIDSWFMHAVKIPTISEPHRIVNKNKVFTMENVVIAFNCLVI